MHGRLRKGEGLHLPLLHERDVVVAHVRGPLFNPLDCLFLFVTVVFLVGGLDGVDTVHQSLSRTWSSSGRGLSMPLSGASKALGSSSGSSRAPLFSRSARLRGIVRSDRITAAARVPVAPSSNDTPEDKTNEPQNEESPRSGDSSDSDVSLRGTDQCRRAFFAGGLPARQARARHKSGCLGLGERVKRWTSRVPMNKVKVLVVVWQILTEYPSVSGVEASYSRFLSWIDVVNFDLGTILSASCLVGTVKLYHTLLLATLAPLGLVLVLVCTYWVVKRGAGTGSVSMLAKRAAWTRHMAAGLLLAFLVSPAVVVHAVFFACVLISLLKEDVVRGDYPFRAAHMHLVSLRLMYSIIVRKRARFLDCQRLIHASTIWSLRSPLGAHLDVYRRVSDVRLRRGSSGGRDLFQS